MSGPASNGDRFYLIGEIVLFRRLVNALSACLSQLPNQSWHFGWVPAREESSESANLCFIGATSITLSPCTATIALGLKVVKNARNNRAATTTVPRLANSFTPLLSS